METYTAKQLWEWALALPEQLAAEPPGRNVPSTSSPPPRRNLVCGMGGSGVSAQFLSARGPFIPWRWATAPAWLDDSDSLTALSYSGETFETLAVTRKALASGVRVSGVTTGGELGRLLDDHTAPRWELPVGMPPRAAFGHLLGAALRLGGRLIGEPLWDPVEVTRRLAELRDDLVHDDFTSLRPLAASLAGRRLVVYGTCPLSAAAALRWKQQLNENAKLHCWNGALPEAAHNEIEAADSGKPPRRVVLTLADEPPPLDEVIGDHEVGLAFSAPPGEPLTRTLYLVLLGDLLSLLIAAERGVDPGSIPRITAFKQTGWARRVYTQGED
jgi:glucose/mannose-6-phosphate isomerase